MKFYTYICILVSVLGCQQEPEIIASQATISLTGRITTTENNAVDSDINDLSAFFSNNNSIQTAQAIPNPITLSGYVNIANTGNQGRSYAQGDPDDFYSTYLLPNQIVRIFIDTNTVTSHIIDFSLFIVKMTNWLTLYIFFVLKSIIKSSLIWNSKKEITTFSYLRIYPNFTS